jgi:hypothetical protein
MVSCDAEKLGEPLYHQLRASIVYEPREQGKATEGVEKEVRREGDGMIVLVAIVTVVAGRMGFSLPCRQERWRTVEVVSKLTFFLDARAKGERSAKTRSPGLSRIEGAISLSIRIRGPDGAQDLGKMIAAGP